jgi:hypothetical protein
VHNSNTPASIIGDTMDNGRARSYADYVYLFSFRDRVLPSGLRIPDPPALASQVVGLQGSVITLGSTLAF